MGILKVSIFILSCVVFLSCTEKIYTPTQAQEDGGDSVGNGGDAIIAVFNDARLLALKNLERVDQCNLEQVTPNPNVIKFILAHKKQLIEDVKKSRHVWANSNPENTCGMTKQKRNSDIVLFIHNCKNEMEDKNSAVWTLVHESVHHFGVGDEPFADDVAEAVELGARLLGCDFNPFDPEFCKPTVEKLGPPINGTKSLSSAGEPYHTKVLGEFELITRRRFCSQIGCDRWTSLNWEKGFFYDGKGKPVKVPRFGEMVLKANAAKQEWLIQTVGTRLCQATESATFCDFGIGPTEDDDVYFKYYDEKQKVSFETVFNLSCVRQFSRQIFREPNITEWTEVEHVIYYQNN